MLTQLRRISCITLSWKRILSLIISMKVYSYIVFGGTDARPKILSG